MYTAQFCFHVELLAVTTTHFCATTAFGAGAALGPSEQWNKVAVMVRDYGRAVPIEVLKKGHAQLRSTASDLLTWLNGSNLGM